jgi:hypothetical protein
MGAHVSFATNDRVKYGPELAKFYGEAKQGRVGTTHYDTTPHQMCVVVWDDGSISWGVHHSNLEKVMSEPVVTSRPLPGTPYREHIITLDGVELRVQMSAYTPEEIAEAVHLYKTMGIRTPRHDNSEPWNNHLIPPTRASAGGAAMDSIIYDGLYFED